MCLFNHSQFPFFSHVIIQIKFSKRFECRLFSDSVRKGSMDSWEPTNFWALGARIYQFSEETTKFTEKSVKNVVFVTILYSYPKSLVGERKHE